ncbi:MAG: hypothetical protein M1835_002214 [Candelina submexicana]|nr:MAG: hypothetical protein M1835_002214 [Candelina submexicana]
MPSQRRLRIYVILVLIVVVYILYTTSDARQPRSQDFYAKTVTAMNAKQRAQADADNAEINQKLKKAENAAKNAAERKFARPPEGVAGVAGDRILGADEKTVAGRKKMKTTAAGEAEAPLVLTEEEAAAKKKADTEKEAEREVDNELNGILKRSPIIIFSKTYCPYSKKAKRILLEKLKIVPPPFVVELDEHPLGIGLQFALQKSTGRQTVPNVLINGKSIGGGDDIEDLDKGGLLVEKIRSMAGKRVMEVGRRPVS